MEFKIYVAGTSGSYAIDRPKRPIGTDGVDFIRKSLKMPSLDLARMNGANKGVESDPTIVISEEVARESGHFKEHNTIQIDIVSPTVLDGVIHERAYADTDNNTGEIRVAWIGDEVDREAIIAMWAEAGYPLIWGIEEEQSE